MSWMKIITILVAVALVVGGAVWAYRLFEAPESIDTITANWSESGHADATSESFIHWDEDDPLEIPEACAKCHSLYGYLDFLGVDGTAQREVDSPALTGSVLYCNTCHSEVAHTFDSVVYPGGAEITDVGGRWANCMRCHQGRTSTATVNEATAGLEPNAVSEDLGFINVHYAIGAATRYGSEVSVGYQYDGRDYVGWYPHVEDYDACTECHDAHSTAINAEACQPCHANVVDYGDLFTIRESTVDYDGDGDTDEGIQDEIFALHGALYDAIRTYSADVIDAPIVYTGEFPYWAVDTNGNGEVDEDEASPGNAYDSWTPRLLRAAYNYHYVIEDPGAFTHNAEYVLQLLYDAIDDLGQEIEVQTETYVRP